MLDYTDYFKLETKCLLKDFRKNLPYAVEECQKYFFDKKDLTLMNIQHVIAKKYGFHSWNELLKAGKSKQSEALIREKNKNFCSPFSVWSLDGGLQIEDKKIDLQGSCCAQLNKLSDKNNKIIRQAQDEKTFGRTAYGQPLEVNLRHADVSAYDFSNFHISELVFNEETIWPADETKKPRGLQPSEFLRLRRKSGLNLRCLHKKGITGRLRRVALIVDEKLVDHLEYHDNIADYLELGERGDNNGAGLYVSAVVGKTCGVVPEAKLYCYSVPYNNETTSSPLNDYVLVLNKICDLHEKLVKLGQNGIDAVCLVSVFLRHNSKTVKKYEDMRLALERTKSLGIFIVSPFMSEDYGFKYGKAGCKADGDPDNPADYVGFEDAQDKLFFPFCGMAVADFTRMGLYMYSPFGFSGLARICGLYILAKSVKSDLTPQMFWEQGIKTAYQMTDGGLLYNPIAMTESLSKE